MLKLSKLTDYAVVLMAHLARHPRDRFAAQELAEATGLPHPTVSKLLKLLVKAGLLDSQRGAQGGYQLLRSAQSISASDLILAIEGPVAMTECSLDDAQCDLLGQCGVASNWQRVTLAVHQLLASVSLAELAQPQAIRLPWRKIPLQDISVSK